MIKYTSVYDTPKTNLVTEDRPNPHALVRAQVVSDIADYDIGHLVNGTTRFGVIVSAARVPAVRRNDVNLTSDMAEA